MSEHPSTLPIKRTFTPHVLSSFQGRFLPLNAFAVDCSSFRANLLRRLETGGLQDREEDPQGYNAMYINIPSEQWGSDTLLLVVS